MSKQYLKRLPARRALASTLANLATVALAIAMVATTAVAAPPADNAKPAADIEIPKPLTLVWVKDQIKAHGATYVVGALFARNRYDELMNHTDRGEADWIALAPQLADGTDGATAEILAISLALGLPRNPAAVLSVLDPQVEPLNPERVCGAPFIEDTVKDIPGYIERSQAAVQRVGDSRLAKQKAACLDHLKQAAKIVQPNRRK